MQFDMSEERRFGTSSIWKKSIVLWLKWEKKQETYDCMAKIKTFFMAFAAGYIVLNDERSVYFRSVNERHFSDFLYCFKFFKIQTSHFGLI